MKKFFVNVTVSMVMMIILFLGACASVAPFPASGPQQKTSAVVANPNCLLNCEVTVSQSTALEEVKNNSGTVTAGAQSQSVTQSSTLSPATTNTSTVTKSKDD